MSEPTQQISKILLKENSDAAGIAPRTDELDLRELAINTKDGRVYTKRDGDDGEEIIEISPVSLLQRELINDFPTVRPELDANFAAQGALGRFFTFSRTSKADFVNSKGVTQTAQAGEPRFTYDRQTYEAEGILIEAAATNALTRSESFNTGWTAAAAFVIPSAGLAPSSTFSAAKIVPTTQSTSIHGISNGSFAANTWTASLFVKAAGYNFVALELVSETNGFAVFDLSTGAFVNIPSAVTYTAVEEYDDGWYRISMTVAATATRVFRIRVQSTATWNASFAGNGLDGVLVWGGQVESNPFQTSYVPTPTTFTSRASIATFYDATGTLQTALAEEARAAAFFPDDEAIMRPAGLFIEPAGTNLVTESEVFSNTGGGTGTWTAEAATAPDGTETAAKWTPSSGGANANSSRRPFATATGLRTASVFVKKAELRYVMLSITQSTGPSYGVLFDLDTAAFVKDNQVSSPTDLGFFIQRFPSGWYRLSVKTNTLSTGGDTFFNYGATSNGDATFPFPSQISHVGNNSSGTLFWGAQVEAGSFPSSYIQTEAVTVTRAADVSASPTVTRAADVLTLAEENFAAIYNERQGTLVAEFISRGIGLRPVASLDDGTANNQLVLLTSGANTEFETTLAGATDVTLALGSVQALAPVKAAVAFSRDDFSGVKDAGAIDSVSAGALPPVAALRIGVDAAGNASNSTIRRLTYYPVRLPNSQLSTITT